MEENVKKTNIEIANEVAKKSGYKSAKEMVDTVGSKLRSADAGTRALAELESGGIVETLLQLVLKQELMDHPLPNYFNIAERMFDGFLNEGNAKEYVVDNETGITTFADTKFVPEAQTTKNVERYILQLYQEDGQLQPKAYKFIKQQTIPMGTWIPYFKSGNLNAYISKLQQSLNKTFKMYMYQKFCAEVVAENGKIINDDSDNLYDALMKLFVEINHLMEYNKDYNINTNSKQMYAPRWEDIKIFCSRAVKTYIQNGIRTQLFNAQFFGPEGRTITPEMLITLGDKIDVIGTDENTVIQNTTTEWINDQTIIVMDVSRIKHIVQLDQAGAQFFQRNLTTYMSKNVWGVVDTLPWAKKIVFKNSNLRAIPTQITEE